MKIRQQIRFTGRVQGVGFRFTAQHLANALGLTGWVMNDWDGSVKMEVQGNPKTIEKMLEKIEDGIFIEIDRMERTDIPLVDTEFGFNIEG